MRWYHFTSQRNARKIMKEGLRGGNNIHGIGYSDTPTLWLTNQMRADSERYGGYVLAIDIKKEELKKKRAKIIKLGGETICYIEGEGILIEIEKISDLYYEYIHGVCNFDKKYCSAYCEDYKKCPLVHIYKEKKRKIKKTN